MVEAAGETCVCMIKGRAIPRGFRLLLWGLVFVHKSELPPPTMWREEGDRMRNLLTGKKWAKRGLYFFSHR